uniref:Uncharacterized protein n=1 Tax=Rhizophora mucronata TaxID=61149 RepID=A0A2P2NMS0_RHIMU
MWLTTRFYQSPHKHGSFNIKHPHQFDTQQQSGLKASWCLEPILKLLAFSMSIIRYDIMFC